MPPPSTSLQQPGDGASEGAAHKSDAAKSSSPALESSSSTASHLPPLDPATSAMVLSRLQNLSLPGGNAAYNPPQYANDTYPSSSPSTSTMETGSGGDSSSANIDFNAILASLASAAPHFQNHLQQQQQQEQQQPAYVSASQLHPNMDPTMGIASTSSHINGDWSHSSNPSSSNAPKKKVTSKSKATSTPRATSPSDDANNASAAKRVPPFLNKLRNMIDDEATNELICWQPEGKTFLVPNNVRFAKEVLPRFFKHNNFSSFVRQLNMYGFHKVPSLQQGSLKHEQEMEVWEFENENFLRDQPDLMLNVQRKPGHKGDSGDRGEGAQERDDEYDRSKALTDGTIAGGLNSVSGALTRVGDVQTQIQLDSVWQKIHEIRNAQDTINDNLRHLRLSNDSLWQEAMESKRRSEQQSETINRMLRFLAGVFAGQDVLGGNNDPGSPSTGRNRGGQSRAAGNGRGLFRNKSSHPLMIQGGEASSPLDVDRDEADDNSERFHELFTRISEPGSKEGTPTGSRSPAESTSPPKFTTLRSPSLSEEPPTSSSTPKQAKRPSLGETPRRASTPSGGRGNKVAPQQLLSALQQMFASSGGEGSANSSGSPYPSRPGTPFGGRPATPGGGAAGMSSPGTSNPPKIDPNLIASLQSIMAMIQSQQAAGGAGGTGSTDGGLGIFNPAEQSDDSNRFIYPYTGGPTGFTPPASGSQTPMQAANASSPFAFSGTENQITQLTPENPFAQYLQNTEADADTVQKAIAALAEAFRVPGSSSRSGTPGPLSSGPGRSGSSDIGSHSVIPTEEIAPGSWNQYASPAQHPSYRRFDSVDPGSSSSSRRKSSSAGKGSVVGPATNDIDVDSLISQFIDSSASSGSTGREDEAATPSLGIEEDPHAIHGPNGSSGDKTPTPFNETDTTTSTHNTTSPSINVLPPSARQKRKSLESTQDDGDGDDDGDSEAGVKPLPLNGALKKTGEGVTSGAVGGGGSGMISQKRKKTNNERKFGQTSVEDG